MVGEHIDTGQLAANLASARQRVADAARAAGRDPGEVRLLLAVKTQSADVVRAVVEAGADLLGHNRAQELAATGPALAEPGTPPHEMHFIGHLQTNKINQVLRWAGCVQTVDSLRLADKLDAAVSRRAADGAPPEPLDVMVQVNTSGEATKAGVAPERAVELASAVGRLKHLRLRGLMTIGAHTPEEAVVRASYDDLAALRAEILASGAPGTDGAGELSMGMSADLETAVAAGATMVRLGTAVFGPRPAP
ncbi:YggS family pyridoxal phosphate-dependent enzyme [Georgenia deserti]|uniref:Pyridoxal phosphate homeostasis protein n=1 Tax=Georgenia deserti TaxID=2093781 RepID=A0ABW4L5I8_9MICO